MRFDLRSALLYALLCILVLAAAVPAFAQSAPAAEKGKPVATPVKQAVE